MRAISLNKNDDHSKIKKKGSWAGANLVKRPDSESLQLTMQCPLLAWCPSWLSPAPNMYDKSPPLHCNTIGVLTILQILTAVFFLLLKINLFKPHLNCWGISKFSLLSQLSYFCNEAWDILVHTSLQFDTLQVLHEVFFLDVSSNNIFGRTMGTIFTLLQPRHWIVFSTSISKIFAKCLAPIFNSSCRQASKYWKKRTGLCCCPSL